MRRLAPAAAAALLLGGCATLDALFGRAEPAASVAVAAPQPAPAGSPVTPANELVAYLARIRSLDERALAAEIARARRAARQRPSDLARLKVAIALSLAAQAEEAEILGLVEPVARKDRADDDLQAMASFLQVQATERRRLRESAAAATARLREERRTAEGLKQRADALQERAQELQAKLDALTELEKSLSDRQTQAR